MYNTRGPRAELLGLILIPVHGEAGGEFLARLLVCTWPESEGQARKALLKLQDYALTKRMGSFPSNFPEMGLPPNVVCSCVDGLYLPICSMVTNFCKYLAKQSLIGRRV
eukprot:scaffold73075_cov13-Tisochrysis_lutea.AAC.1